MDILEWDGSVVTGKGWSNLSANWKSILHTAELELAMDENYEAAAYARDLSNVEALEQQEVFNAMLVLGSYALADVEYHINCNNYDTEERAGGGYVENELIVLDGIHTFKSSEFDFEVSWSTYTADDEVWAFICD